MPLADYQTIVDNKVRDDASVIQTTDRDQAIVSAVIRYSNDKPNESVEDVVSAGGHYVDLPPSWETNFSSIKAMEFPIGDIPPSYLVPAAWGVYNAPGGKTIMVKDSLSVGSIVRIVFNVQHVVGVADDTPPIIHREAISSWAAALLCEQLSSYYSGDSNNLIQADSVDHASKARDFAARVRTYRKFYFDTLGVDPKKNIAAGVQVDLDMKNSRGRDRFTHSNKYR